MDRLLLNYLPHVLREVEELRRVMDAEQPEIIQLWEYLLDALDEQFISTATVYGLRRWESMLGLVPRGTDSLDARRFAILTRLNEKLPFTIRVLRAMLTALCGEDGFDLELINDEYKLRVQIEQTSGVDFGAVIDMLARVVPCNLLLRLFQQLEPGRLWLKIGAASRTYSRERLQFTIHNS